MDPITIGAGIVILVTSSMALMIKKYRRSLKLAEAEKRDLLRTLGQVEDGYIGEAADEVLLERCREVLDRLCPCGVGEKFAELKSLGERKIFLKELINQTKHAMRVEIDDVRICELPMSQIGGYVYNDERNRLHKTIFLNELYLLEAPERCIQTVFHELKHAVQNEAIFEKNQWGYSAQRRAQWLSCLKDGCYVDGTMSFEAYVLQSIEIDARHFAASVFH